MDLMHSVFNVNQFVIHALTILHVIHVSAQHHLGFYHLVLVLMVIMIILRINVLNVDINV